MTSIIENVKAILHTTQKIAGHQEEVKKLRGESFNVFSILKMESRENETHSAFIGELLNPKGSHLQGSTFLKLFLETVNSKNNLDLETATIKLEKHVGNRNDLFKTGGRIDIYIFDALGNSISIENKIYATDQNAQIQRYVNHNKTKNKVYYLTLDGKLPEKESCGNLRAEQDYHCISYKTTILNWLQKCLKESVDKPILRESIRQYIILIKKLTNQLTDTNMEKEILEIISKNYTAAKYIQSNVQKAENDSVYQFLLQVKEKLQHSLGNEWAITVDEQLTESWTGIRIEFTSWNGIHLRLQGEPKLIGGKSIYGIVAHKDEYNRAEVDKRLSSVNHEGSSSSAYWPMYWSINLFHNPSSFEQLFDDNKRNSLIEDVFWKLLDLSVACKDLLSDIQHLKK